VGRRPLDAFLWALSHNFHGHLSEVGPTQNRETMATRTLTIPIGLFYFMIMWVSIEIADWLLAWSQMASHYT
jgi:hypothetical protein